MEKLAMCRICLVGNVRMFVVVDKNLHEVYEKLSDIPFVTEDRRPMLACYICCAKLKQCYRLLRQCLEAEKLFAQMMNEDYELNPLIQQDHKVVFRGFIKSPTENINIVDVIQTDSIAIKKELPAVCEGLDIIIEPKEEHQSYELEPLNFDDTCLGVADIPPHLTESDLEDDVPIMRFKTEVEEQGVYKHKQTRVIVSKKRKIDTRRTKLEDAITVEQAKKEKSGSKVIWINKTRTSIPVTKKAGFKELYKCDQRSFNPVKQILQNTCTQIGEKHFKCDVCQRSLSDKRSLLRHTRQHTGEKPFKCDVCQRSFGEKRSLLRHIRIHTGEKPYKCDVCQRSFGENCALARHIRIHTGEKHYKCDLCERSFRDRSILKNHIRVHTGGKPFKCDVCQRSFRQSSYLKIHIRQHTGEKPYKCDICQRSFIQRSTLTNHIRLHTGEKPFKCDICQCSFSKNVNLRKHVRIHTGK